MRRARPEAPDGATGDAELDGAVAAVAELYPALYLRLHRLREKGGLRPDGQMLAVLSHLAMAGPLTVTETAHHMDRAQSVMSELIQRLSRRGLLDRMADMRDRRRTLVYLTKAGEELLQEEGEVLARPRVRRALLLMMPKDRRALLRGMRAFLSAAEQLRPAAEERVGRTT
jgi:DNA-binding MarR family transcriptional regulator